jgi:hypothetical protein
VFSDAFHQDLVVDQYNMQLFILLQDTTESDGPFEYLDADVQAREMDFYRKRNRKAPLTKSRKLVGKRGDYLLFTTGLTLHRAGIPDKNCHRDINLKFMGDAMRFSLGYTFVLPSFDLR